MKLSFDRLPPSFTVLGLMSGTSLDGLDLALVRFYRERKRIRYEIVHCEAYHYSREMVERLDKLIHLDKSTIRAFERDYTEVLIYAIRDFLQQKNIRPDIIASHGHTVFHQPEAGITLQIGDGKRMAQELHIPVVYDFRTQDVALGGQGAPLVPIGDELLFGTYDYCLNLGGIANISYSKASVRKAYDVSPCNLVLNFLSKKQGLAYDKGGTLAASGYLIPELLKRWDDLDYYRMPAPKSLGREWVEMHFYNPDYIAYRNEDVLRTAVEHIARMIGASLKGKGRVLVTGGGAWNHFLIRRIQANTQTQIILPEDTLIAYKEALIFALLGYLRWHQLPNVLSSVTGASHNHCSGRIATANP